jgi:hypothetical protein
MNLRSLEQIDDEKLCHVVPWPFLLADCAASISTETVRQHLNLVHECVRMPAGGGPRLPTSFFFLTRGFFFRYARGVLR